MANHKTIDRTVYPVIGDAIKKAKTEVTTALDQFKTEVASVYATKESTASAYNYCDSVETYDKLPQDAKKGDVYNVQTDGMNYAWDGAEWDELGMIIDLDTLATKAEVTAGLALKVDQTAYDTKIGAVDSTLTRLEGLITTNTLSISSESTRLEGMINANTNALDTKVDKVEGSSLITAEKLALIDTNQTNIASLQSTKADKTELEPLATKEQLSIYATTETVSGINTRLTSVEEQITGLAEFLAEVI